MTVRQKIIYELDPHNRFKSVSVEVIATKIFERQHNGHADLSTSGTIIGFLGHDDS